MGACVICGDHITNPLSPQRLQLQMQVWLAQTSPQLIAPVVKRATELVTPLKHANDRCIITGKAMNVCAYCFTEHVYNWLVETNQPQELVSEYLTYFNFDGEKLGYWQDALARGYAE